MLNKKNGHMRRPVFWVGGLLLLAVVVLLVLELTNTTHIFHQKKVPATIPITTTKSSSTQSKKAGSTSSSSGQAQTQSTKVASSGGVSGAEASTGQPPAQPYGDFISNHWPGENGSDTKEQSTCDTTPGATCYIQFTSTSDGTITKLPAQTVGGDGSTFWSWDSTILTTGEWKITAVADLHGQTKSADDTIKLVIK